MVNNKVVWLFYCKTFFKETTHKLFKHCSCVELPIATSRLMTSIPLSGDSRILLLYYSKQKKKKF